MNRAIHNACLITAFFTLGAGRIEAQSPVVQVTRLTTSGARNGQGFWSPDGHTLSFVSNRSGTWQIVAMPAAGGEATQLTHSPGAVGWLSWTPDGSEASTMLKPSRDIAYFVSDSPKVFRCPCSMRGGMIFALY